MNSTHHNSISLPHWRHHSQLKGLRGIYFNTTFRVLSIGISGVFIPIFVLKILGNIEGVLLFFLTAYLLSFFASLFSIRLIATIGPDWSMAGAAILRILFFVALTLATKFAWLIWLAAGFWALSMPLNWIPYHLAFTRQSSQGSVGRQVGVVSIIGRLAAAISPFLGGLIAVFLGFSWLWVVTIFFMFLSVIPLFLDQYDRKDPPVPPSLIFKGFTDKKLTPFFLSFLGTGIEAVVYGIAWPIFIYQTINSLKILGTISSLSLLASLILAIWVSKETRSASRRMINFGTRANGFNWLVKIGLSSVFWLGFSDLFYQLAGVFVNIPVMAATYNQARGKSFEFIVQRDLAIRFGSCLGIGLIWLALVWRGQWWGLTFLVGFLSLGLIGAIARDL